MTDYTGGFNTPGTSAEINLVLAVTLASQSVTANTSLLSWSFYMQEYVNANPFNLNGNCTASASVGGTVYSSGGLKYDFRSTNATVPIASGSKTISHNADGTKSVALSASYSDGSNIIGSASIGATFVLPTIPRNRIVVRDDDDEFVTAAFHARVNGVLVPAQLYARETVGGPFKLCGGLS